MTSEVTKAVVVDESIRLVGLPSGDSRVVIVRNGIDPDDIATTCQAEGRSTTFRLSYIGALYGSRDAGAVFAAMKTLIASGVLDPRRFELRIAGTISMDRSSFDSLPVTEIGYVDHRRAVQEMAEASVLLFYSPRGELGSSGKIYEYLVAGRPVLCVADRDSRAFGLVHDLGAGECVEPEPNAVAVALERLIRQWEVGQLTVDRAVREEMLRRYSRRALAFELGRVLEEALSRGKTTPKLQRGGGPPPLASATQT